MYLIAIAWLYVVLMMAVAEALSSQGTVLGAIVTLVLYGLLPLSVVLYIVGTPMRRRARLAAEAAEARAAAPAADTSAGPPSGDPSSPPPDGSSHAAGDAVAPERKEV